MADLIPPHGGLTEPIDRNVPAAEVADFRAGLAGLPRLVVSDADLSTLYRMGDGGQMVQKDEGTALVGGTVRVLPQTPHREYGRFVLSPRQTRALFREKGWKRVVAFQTRNPLHRAHEYALVAGLERLTREGHFTGAVLNPLVGETKGDDVDAATRMRTYRALIETKALGQGDKDEELWKKAGCDITDRI